jgi:hypothetical protein
MEWYWIVLIAVCLLSITLGLLGLINVGTVCGQYLRDIRNELRRQNNAKGYPEL